MPPLPPNIHRATILKTLPSWNQQTCSRRDNHTRFLTKRFPVKPSLDTSWVNPSLPPGVSRLAQPKGSLRQPHNLIPSSESSSEREWLLIYTAPLQARTSGAPNGSVALAYDADAFAVSYPNNKPGVNSKALSYLATSGEFNQLYSEVTGGTNYGQSILLTTKAKGVDHMLIVGDPTDGTNAGCAVVYRANNSGLWEEVTSLVGNTLENTPGNMLGYSLSISLFDSINNYWYVANGAPSNGTSLEPFVDVVALQVSSETTLLERHYREKGSSFGTSVAISDILSDTELNSIRIRLAASAPSAFTPYVEVIERDGAGIWRKVNTNINSPETTTQFGASVSLSGDGTILAIGDPDVGKVRIYYDTGSAWTLIGGTALTGQNSTSLFGQAVSVNRHASSSSLIGTTIAIGEPKYSLPTRTECGRVLVMEYLATGWTRVLNSIYGVNENEEFGQSVVIAPGGEYFVATGGPDIGRTAVYSTLPLDG